MPKYKTLTEYEKRKVIEIDLNYYYYLIENKKEISIVDKDKTLNKKGKEWIKLLTMQIWCVNEEEAYTFPNLKDLHFYQNQPQLKNALKILNAHMPLYKLIIQKENEEMDKTGQFQKLQKDNKK